MEILENQIEISQAQKIFYESIIIHSTENIPIIIGFQSGNLHANVEWLSEYNIWAFFGNPPHGKSSGERYWNVFGIGKPSGMVKIICEINSPKKGINRLAAGAFAKDEIGDLFLLHRGNFNAGGRVPYDFTRQVFKWGWTWVNEAGSQNQFMVISQLGSNLFIKNIVEFIHRVNDFKLIARSRPWI